MSFSRWPNTTKQNGKALRASQSFKVNT